MYLKMIGKEKTVLCALGPKASCSVILHGLSDPNTCVVSPTKE